MARFVPNKPGIRYVLTSLSGPVGRHIGRLSASTYLLARQQVGVDTGELRASLQWSVGIRRGMPSGRIGSNNDIAYLHHEGSSPHLIRPRNKKVLRFQKHGTIVYARSVQHPGTAPNRYLTDSLRAVV